MLNYVNDLEENENTSTNCPNGHRVLELSLYYDNDDVETIYDRYTPAQIRNDNRHNVLRNVYEDLPYKSTNLTMNLMTLTAFYRQNSKDICF